MLILQEESFLQILSKNYNDVIDNLYPHIDENKTIYKKTPESLLIRIRSNFILAECFNEIGRFSESIIRSRMALDDLSDNEYLIKPFIFQSIAKSYIKLGKMDSSKRYLNEIIPYIERSNNIELKRRFYLLEADYFKHVKNESLAYRYIESYSKIEEQKKIIIQSMVNRMIKSNQLETERLKRNNVILIWIIIISFIVFLIYYFVKNPKLKKQNYFQASTTNIKNKELTNLKIQDSDSFLDNSDFHISLETETRLVKKLNDLEKDYFFLEKNITLTRLTSKLNTNQKYVSYIIRKYKNQNFTEYVLNLRIQYVIDKLENNKVMLNYKLSYLAEMSGFTSHSKFTMAFKNAMGITPSQFIEELKKENI